MPIPIESFRQQVLDQFKSVGRKFALEGAQRLGTNDPEAWILLRQLPTVGDDMNRAVKIIDELSEILKKYQIDDPNLRLILQPLPPKVSQRLTPTHTLVDRVVESEKPSAPSLKPEGNVPASLNSMFLMNIFRRTESAEVQFRSKSEMVEIMFGVKLVSSTDPEIIKEIRRVVGRYDTVKNYVLKSLIDPNPPKAIDKAFSLFIEHFPEFRELSRFELVQSIKKGSELYSQPPAVEVPKNVEPAVLSNEVTRKESKTEQYIRMRFELNNDGSIKYTDSDIAKVVYADALPHDPSQITEDLIKKVTGNLLALRSQVSYGLEFPDDSRYNRIRERVAREKNKDPRLFMLSSKETVEFLYGRSYNLPSLSEVVPAIQEEVIPSVALPELKEANDLTLSDHELLLLMKILKKWDPKKQASLNINLSSSDRTLLFISWTRLESKIGRPVLKLSHLKSLCAKLNKLRSDRDAVLAANTENQEAQKLLLALKNINSDAVNDIRNDAINFGLVKKDEEVVSQVITDDSKNGDVVVANSGGTVYPRNENNDKHHEISERKNIDLKFSPGDTFWTAVGYALLPENIIKLSGLNGLNSGDIPRVTKIVGRFRTHSEVLGKKQALLEKLPEKLGALYGSFGATVSNTDTDAIFIIGKLLAISDRRTFGLVVNSIIETANNLNNVGQVYAQLKQK